MVESTNCSICITEVESRILKALQPKLGLDPTTKLDRLVENITSTKLNLGLRNMRKRLRQIPNVTVTNNIHGKKICIYGGSESSRIGDSGFVQPLLENQQKQSNGQNSMIGVRSNCGPSHPGQDMVITYSDNAVPGASALHVRRDSQDVQPNPNKRSRNTSVKAYRNQQQHMGSPMDNFQEQVMSFTFPQIPWNNLGQPLESNARKEDSYQKWKIVQSPRVSAGGIPQSPLSSKSEEFSSGSVGHQLGGAVTSGYLPPQKEKVVNMSMTSSANDHHQAQLASKRRSNSAPKNPAMSGVGSPASVSNMSMPINVGSPPVLLLVVLLWLIQSFLIGSPKLKWLLLGSR
ncbi:hypothetical protein OROMI_016184 [Orobanche minor]